MINEIKNQQEEISSLPSKDEKPARIESAKKILDLVKIVLEIFTLGIVLFALKTCSSEFNLYRRQLTVEEINSLKDKEFLTTLAKLHTIASEVDTTSTDFNCNTIIFLYDEKNCDKAKNLVISDVNYMLNKYESIASYYFNNLVEKEVLQNTISTEANEFNNLLKKLTPVLNKIMPSFENYLSKDKFDEFLKEINN